MWSLVEQGITAVIGGNCGFSPAPVEPQARDLVLKNAEVFCSRPLEMDWTSWLDFATRLESGSGLLLNLAQITGHGSIRLSVIGEGDRNPNMSELSRMRAMAEQACDEGACGISLGLAYDPGIFAGRDELLAFARLASERDMVLTVHARAFTRVSPVYPLRPFGEAHNIRAFREILDLATEAKVKLQLSHLLFVGTKSYATAKPIIKMIEEAAAGGLDVMWDLFPYACGNTMLRIVLPPWFLADMESNINSRWAKKRLRLELYIEQKLIGFDIGSDMQVMDAGFSGGEWMSGLSIADIAGKMGIGVFDAFFHLVRESMGRTLILFHKYSGHEGNMGVIDSLMSHPFSLYQADVIMRDRGFKNPSGVGTFPRILGHYVRKRGMLSLPEAVSRMTLRSAERFGLADVGLLEKGRRADVVLFNPDTVGDNTTICNSDEKPDGIEYVFINGTMVVRKGRYIAGVKPGKVLRRR